MIFCELDFRFCFQARETGVVVKVFEVFPFLSCVATGGSLSHCFTTPSKPKAVLITTFPREMIRAGDGWTLRAFAALRAVCPLRDMCFFDGLG